MAHGRYPDGTYMVQDICPGSCSSTPIKLSLGPNGSIYFVAYTPKNGFEPWVYYPDGVSSTNPDLIGTKTGDFTVYPNPASDRLTIERIDASYSCQVQLMDCMGRSRFTLLIEIGATQAYTSLAQLENGFYYITMWNSSGDLVGGEKVVVNKL
jgi:Secretion system C-terminal sorting domain